ncbi:MAG: NAD(P)H-dependent oxidoreductase [Myxococcaceae bacterium]|jgi:chromate reductase|nr:NAD(P)H-dependent oxidoreductase [Myxococcaceae bacterium]MCA3011833.1 NAD(P)H-dependent oxidoreductase [Myxococcaceae bacterium]
MRVLAFSGSLRTGSWNEQLLAVAVQGLSARGVEVDTWRFKAANVPIYDPDTSDAAPAPGVVDFKARVRAAAGLLIACPEYNYSYPGALKNLLDAASRPPHDNPFRGRVTAQLGATNGPGGTLQAQVMLRHVLAGLGCHTLPGAFTVSRVAEALDERGALKDEAQRRNLEVFLDRFVEELSLRSR